MVAENDKLELTELRDKLTEFLNKIGLSGTAEITLDEDEIYKIKFGEHTFSGFYPDVPDPVFTLQLISTTKVLPTDLEVDYIEAFVFRIKDFVPSEFIIHQYPQTQTYFITDGKYEKGKIFYETFCPCTGCISGMEFEEVAFESEIIDISRLKEL